MDDVPSFFGDDRLVDVSPVLLCVEVDARLVDNFSVSPVLPGVKVDVFTVSPVFLGVKVAAALKLPFIASDEQVFFVPFEPAMLP